MGRRGVIVEDPQYIVRVNFLAYKPDCVGAHVRYDDNIAYRNVLNVQPTRHFDVFYVRTYYLLYRVNAASMRWFS
jgi:hypothetical protein